MSAGRRRSEQTFCEVAKIPGGIRIDVCPLGLEHFLLQTVYVLHGCEGGKQVRLRMLRSEGHPVGGKPGGVVRLTARNGGEQDQRHAGNGGFRGGKAARLGEKNIAGAHIFRHARRAFQNQNPAVSLILFAEPFVQSPSFPAENDERAVFFARQKSAQNIGRLRNASSADAAAGKQTAEALFRKPQPFSGFLLREGEGEFPVHRYAEGQKLFGRNAPAGNSAESSAEGMT